MIKKLSGLIYYHVYDDQGMQHKYVKGIVQRIKSPQIWKWLSKIVKYMCTMNNHKDATHVGILSCDAYDEKCYWYLEDIKETIDLPFEDMLVKVPIGYDRSLKIGYGDYMEFPPIKERGNWHQNIFYDPYKPYTEYENRKELFC